LFAQEPEFVVAGAAGADVLEVVGADEDVVPGNEVHHAEECGGGDVAGEAGDGTVFEVDEHGVAEALGHEGDALVVRGDVGALAEVRENFDVGRKVVERIAGIALGEQQRESEQGVHGRIVAKAQGSRLRPCMSQSI
jgi:hypothetical protein